MSEKRRGLGRGLGALISSSPVVESEVEAPKDVSRETPKSSAARATKTANVTAPKRRTTPSAPSNKKARPVDMFFVPGKTEAEAEAEAEESAGPSSVAAKKRRAQMPGLIASSGRAGDLEPIESVTDDLVEVPGARFAEISVGQIHPNRKQPRSYFDEEHMAELVHSIREVGLLQPIVVRPSRENDKEPYEIVMGERRWRATQAAGLETIPAIVRETQDDDLLRDALLENLHRSQLNPLEEAAAYQQLLSEFSCTQEELSERIGRSRSQISNTIRLMKLPALVQRRVAAGVISAGHARALLGLVDAVAIEELAQRIVNEGLSVRSTEEAVALSDGQAKKTKANTPKQTARHERLDFLATSLSDRLDTNVKISLGARKGKVSIEFASVDDLNRIMSVLSPESIEK
ncbi:MAG: ParB/RepB/Spo0J family partition protein [Paeniglutamicibacter terrestris]|uniref:ParB/RepB/Spo0J family partition protein n=1 Tax=Paeniglutamicibacter terrestris TaxID=2723403 RepID=A0ABX1G9C7_9MICC|nr:ParB/RepB/Spo0J family partition protein [Paeniglutamicibacter terrestris]ASN37626.1 chromosome partitioning protein ParB [Arthrobacter sp. 7749]NKG22873.1 ParB/RepB/Spo0J family partition protein [Paeniglutamicibacter terrestris]